MELFTPSRFFMVCTGTCVPLYVVSSLRLFDIPRQSWEGNTECLDDICLKRKICVSEPLLTFSLHRYGGKH